MKITPPTRVVDRPAAILLPGKRRLSVLTIEGERTYQGTRAVTQALQSLTGHCCYVLSTLSALRHTTNPMGWQCHLWKGRETRMVHHETGVSVSSLRGTLENSTNPFDELQKVLGWLSTYGVAAGSIPAMAWALFRSSLPQDYTIGFDPEISQQAFFGGRQEAPRPQVFTHMASYDIRAAYPVAQASKPYALSLRQVHVKSILDPDAAGLAECSINVPDEMPFAPVPVRIAPGMISFQHGLVKGIWPWVEVSAAMALGCEVKINRLWAPRRTADLFGAWWPMVLEGRQLPGPAGVLAKSIANSCWGQFGMTGKDRAVRTWSDESGDAFYDTPEPQRGMPHEWTAIIGAETTARVRVRMLLEGLYGNCQPVYCDTDGIIVPEGSPMPDDSGTLAGQWSVKATMPTVDIRGPQFYRWTCGAACGVDHAEWHFNCSGVAAEDAPKLFAKSAAELGPHIDWARAFDGDQNLSRLASMNRTSQVIEQW